jgi:hypothetical protein
MVWFFRQTFCKKILPNCVNQPAVQSNFSIFRGVSLLWVSPGFLFPILFCLVIPYVRAAAGLRDGLSPARTRSSNYPQITSPRFAWLPRAIIDRTNNRTTAQYGQQQLELYMITMTRMRRDPSRTRMVWGC